MVMSINLLITNQTTTSLYKICVIYCRPWNCWYTVIEIFTIYQVKILMISSHKFLMFQILSRAKNLLYLQKCLYAFLCVFCSKEHISYFNQYLQYNILYQNIGFLKKIIFIMKFEYGKKCITESIVNTYSIFDILLL